MTSPQMANISAERLSLVFEPPECRSSGTAGLCRAGATPEPGRVTERSEPRSDRARATVTALPWLDDLAAFVRMHRSTLANASLSIQPLVAARAAASSP